MPFSNESGKSITLKRSTAAVHSSYPPGSTGYHLFQNERMFLGAIIELPSGHWQAHVPGSRHQVDPFEAMQDVLNYRERLFTEQGSD